MIVDELWRDVRLLGRTFRREPALVAGVVATFALAIGTNATMFGLVKRLMLAPPPGIREADRVMQVQLTYAGEEGRTYQLSTTSYPAFLALAASGGAPGGVFTAVAAERPDSMTLGLGADLSEVPTVQASGDYFTTLGVRPAAGRLFGPADDERPRGNDVVVISHAFWQRHFGGAPNAIGSRLVVDEQPLTVIGVAPREFNGTGLSSVDLFVPLTTAMRKQDAGWYSNPGMRVVSIVARLRDGASPVAAGATVASLLRPADGDPSRDRLVAAPLESLVPGASVRDSAQGRIALWLSGVSLAVLLIATANVGTLLLLRAVRRRREAAVRIALGASQARLVAQSLVEGLAFALLGSAAGLLLARWFDTIVRATLLPNLAASDRVVDVNVLAASVVAAAAAGLVAGLIPHLHRRERNVSVDLRSGGGHGSSGRFVAQHLLVAFQVALCTVLLVGAGLFVRSLRRVQSQDLGFSTSRLLDVTLDYNGRLDGIERDLAHEEAVRRILTVPGVVSATVVQGMPFSSHHIPAISVPGYTFPSPTSVQLPIMYGATPRYLSMMDVVLREGRLIEERDVRGSPLVVLVNETMARTIWPGQSALGKCVRAGTGAMGEGDFPMPPCREVVGVVRDSRARSLRTEGHEDKLMQYYVPFGQLPAPPMPNPSAVHGILVQTAGPPNRMVAPVQRMIQGTSALPVHARVRPYQDLIDPQLRTWRLGAVLFTAFGALALGIASVGLFAVVSYLVTQRTSEIGVRLALGGSGRAVAGLVVRDALRMAGAGAAAGVVIAWSGAPLVQAMLFQTSAREATSAALAALSLLAVTLAASALPAWRASRVSPMMVLRSDT